MSPQIRVLLGFDCDRPRGNFIFSKQGSEMAQIKLNSIQKITRDLDHLLLPRTFFICGQFIESMNKKYGSDVLREAFSPESQLVEIADHTYSHSILKKIETRQDKIPIGTNQISAEYEKNTKIFKKIFKRDFKTRGYRTPLGHYNGLQGEPKILNTLVEVGAKYLSSDCRDKNHSLHPPLKKEDGSPRQPYFYENGLLEIPSMGWQDTAFSGTSKTPLYENPPESYEDIIKYYTILLEEANKIAKETSKDYFIGFVLHPYDNSYYNKNGKFFFDLKSIVEEIQGKFCKYEEVLLQYNS